jgi:hypothetical protein
MINDDERDYAEERANLADMRREQEGEAAHERLVERVTTELRALGTESYLDARESVRRLTEEVDYRLAPNLHRYELLARQQHVALLAATVAAVIEDGPEYDLAAAARGAIAGYRATHSSTVDGDLANRALGHADSRVFGVVQTVLDADEQAQIDAREQADLDETQRSLR